ncbi:tetratricopeptide repeat protein [Streptomyces sp. SID4928]|nr:TIR-like protein FxsC [Streptomyces sp. ACT-1]EGE44704.1 TIR protein [Streptomyces sp. ACT-1]MYR52730.1 tetratricopeptide repeat protein [Streptomyces sp. SID4928]
MTELPEQLKRLGALAGRLGMTAEELADAVLLAAAGYKRDAAASVLPEDDAGPESGLPGPQHQDAQQKAVPPREQTATGGHQVSAYGPAGGGTTQPGVRLTLGQAAALPQALAIGRALRPLRRRWQHGHRTDLHIDATVEDYARTGLLVPHLVPMPERWLDVTVVLDRSSSMDVWDPAVDGLNKILRSLGALRTLNTWHLTWSGTDPVLRDQRGALVPVGEAGRREGQPGRRLVLVVSDCAAPGWRGATLWKHLHGWSRTTSLALFNPLPPRLWHRTGLDLPLTVTTAPEPVAPSGSWEYAPGPPRRWRRDSGIHSWHAVPVLGTDPEELRRWARALMRSDPEGCTAVLIPDTGRPPRRAPRRTPAARAVAPAPDPGARAEAFLRTARTPATRLAVHAAALDTFTLPILHALREQAVPEARLDDLAELLTADLCTVRRNPEADDFYTFRPEALAHLRQSLTRQTAWRTHQALTRHIASRPWTPDGLTAVLHTATGAPLPTALVPFAEAADSVLRQLGVVVPTASEPSTASEPTASEPTASAEPPSSAPSPSSAAPPSSSPAPTEPALDVVGDLLERLERALEVPPQDWLVKIHLLESLAADCARLLGERHPDTLAVRSGLATSYNRAGRVGEAMALRESVLAHHEEILGERHPDTLSARASVAVSLYGVGRVEEAIALETRVLADREEVLGERHPDTLSARANLASSFYAAGRVEDAIALETRVLADSEEVLGERHPDTISARANLASSFYVAGRVGAAMALRERVLADCEEVLGERHPDTLSARASVAVSLYAVGRVEEAIALETRVLADREEILGERHPDTLSARASLATSYNRAGRVGEAMALREAVLADREEVLGERHPDTLSARANLASSFYAAGRVEDAIALETRVLADSEEVLGERHPDTFSARASLATSYNRAGRVGEAMALRERVLADCEEVLGGRHPDTLSARANLAASLYVVGRVEEAIALETRVLADREEILGARNPDTLSVRSNLAFSFHAIGRVEEAMALREAVLADREEVLGERHPDTLSARVNLAASLYAVGRLEEAEALRVQVLADCEEVLGERHPDTLTARASLAGSLYAVGRVEEAIVLETRVLADREEVLGERHPDTLTARSSLAFSFHAVGRVEEAMALYERVLADSEEVLGGRHPDTLSARAGLAFSFHAAGRTEEAMALYERVLADSEEVLGERHPDTLAARANLADSYEQAGRIEEAAALLGRASIDSEAVGEVPADNPSATSAADGPVEPEPSPGERAARDAERSTSAVPARRRGRTRHGQSPYFFLSYAHTPGDGRSRDPDFSVERFFRDVSGHVLAMTDLPAGAPAGFMDRLMEPGAIWSEQLSERLADCRVFVPLFSPRYFASEVCGREWHAFERRVDHHRARSHQPVDAIVPALWVPVPPGQLPDAASRLQFDHRHFGERYVSDGLYGLMKFEAYAQEYERAVYELAKRIVIVAENVRLEPGSPLDLRLARNAFERSDGDPEDRGPVRRSR